MAKTMSITEVRKALMDLPREMERDKDLRVIEVTRWGEGVLAIIPWDEYESIAETKEILADKPTLRAIAQGLKDAEAGRLYNADEVRKKVGL